MFMLIAVGLTNILASAHSLERFKPKRFKIATHCYMCIGFWVGVLLSLTQYRIGTWFVCGLVSSLLSHIFDIIITRIER